MQLMLERDAFTYDWKPWRQWLLMVALAFIIGYLKRGPFGKPEWIIFAIVSLCLLLKMTFFTCRVEVDSGSMQMKPLWPFRRRRNISHTDVRRYHSSCVENKLGRFPVTVIISVKDASPLLLMGGMKNYRELNELIMRIYPNAETSTVTFRKFFRKSPSPPQATTPDGHDEPTKSSGPQG